MEALLVTTFISLCLAGLFVVAFFIEWKRRGKAGGAGREALIPFDHTSSHGPHAKETDPDHEQG